jgi:riboflavin kinase/FMN adenylyltransferase
LGVVAQSEEGLFQLSAEEFIHELIKDRFRPTHIVEGPSFGFGKDRKGNPEMLVREAARFDCAVHVVDPVWTRHPEGEAVWVSSSLIRKLLGEGKVAEAWECLGRPYRLFGEVIRGEGRGRIIGFPTVNLGAIDQVVPAEGVYAGRALVGEHSHPCAISIGHTPTFGGTARRIEGHLLDFDADLYGKPLALDFQRYLRPQKTFDSPQALIRQLQCDVETVRC